MIRDLNKIFELWKGKVGSKRTPNPKSAEHQYQLREILNDFNWDEEVITELLYNLTEEEFRAIKKDTGNVSTFKTKQARDAAVSRGTHSEEGGEVEDEEDRTSGSEDATEGMTRYEKKRYEAWLNGETTQQQDQSDYLTEEDKKLMEDFDKDLDEYLAEKDPNKKKKLLQAMVDTYQLSMNAPSGDPPQPTKLYIGAISFDARKIFSGDSGNALSRAVVKDIVEMELDVPLAKSGADSPGQKAATASKISMKTVHKDDDPVVTEIFDRSEFDHFDGPKGRKYRQLHGPSDENGDLLPATPENSRRHLEHSMDPDENPTLDKLEAQLEELEKTDNIPKEVRQAVSKHKARMKALMSTPQIDPETGEEFDPQIKIPSKEASEYIEQSWGSMALEMQESSPGITSKIMKNLAEMAEYQRELAKGDEVYLPSSGVFPSGDKIHISRDKTGRVVRISSVSVKYGKAGKYGSYGFPGEVQKYQEYHQDPEYRDRNNGTPGADGYDIGVRDDLVDDDEKFDKVIEESGLSEVLKEPDGKECIKKHIRAFKKKMKELKKKHFGKNKPKKKELKKMKAEVVKANRDLGKKMKSKCLDMDKVNEKLGEDNGRLFSKGPMEAMNILTFAGTLNTSEPPGLGTVAHNHQTIEKNDNPPPKVIYKTHTDQGSPDPKLWVMNFRAFDDRAGGLITSFNKEREEL